VKPPQPVHRVFPSESVAAEAPYDLAQDGHAFADPAAA
jgi:hypothetical protein